MKRLLLLLLLINGSYWATAQNLVNNGSFEQVYCGSQYVTIYKFCDWKVPPNDLNTPDGYHNYSPLNCYPCDCLPDQHTMAGDSYALDGDYFVGILGYYPQGGQINAREYIQTELDEPFQAGQAYEIGFGVKYGSRSKYIIDHMGMHISDSAVGPTNAAPLFDLIPVNPQLDVNQSFGDSSNWTVLSFTYQATGGERFITIGNFVPDSLLSLQINPLYDPSDTVCLLTNYGAYYFIDNVFVYNITSVGHNEQNEFIISPNPAMNHVFIDVCNITVPVRSINVYTPYSNSKLLHLDYDSDCGNRFDINLSDFATGIYLIEIIDQNNQHYLRKIVKI